MTDELCTCARCAAVYPTCCRMDPATAHLCFPLSEAEWQRIAAHTEQSARVEESNSSDFIKAMRTLFPDKREVLANLFPLSGTHYRLATTAEGACVFLNAGGCTLPRKARPWYCQLFPIWIRKGYFDRFAARQCLVTTEARTMSDAFAAVGLTPDEAKELYQALCRDWGL